MVELTIKKIVFCNNEYNEKGLELGYNELCIQVPTLYVWPLVLVISLFMTIIKQTGPSVEIILKYSSKVLNKYLCVCV